MIIDSDTLGLTLAEIEGDAVLFYKSGELPNPEALLEQAKTMFVNFHNHLKIYEQRRICHCGACRTAAKLSLKFVAHSGDVEFIQVKDFNKPYGSDVILVHRLLKNDIQDDEYLLLTNSFDAKLNQTELDRSADWAFILEGESSYESIGAVPFDYVPLNTLHQFTVTPPKPNTYKKSENAVREHIWIDAHRDDVFELLSNLDHRHMWNKSVDRLEYDKDRINRVGTRHKCVIGGHELNFTTITNHFGDDKLVYGEKLDNHPLVDDFTSYSIVESNGGGTHLILEIHYKPKRLLGWIFTPIFRMQMAKQLAAVVKLIKKAAEEEYPNWVAAQKVA